MSKKLFNKLIQRASQPFPDANSGKKTRSRKTANTVRKSSSNSPQSNTQLT